MRSMVIVGALLIVVGIFTLTLPSVYRSSDVDTVGNVTRTQISTLTIPSWTGVAVIAAGIVLLLAGAAAKPRHY